MKINSKQNKNKNLGIIANTIEITSPARSSLLVNFMNYCLLVLSNYCTQQWNLASAAKSNISAQALNSA